MTKNTRDRLPVNMQLVNDETASALLGIAVSTLRRWRSRGWRNAHGDDYGPAWVRIGGRVLYDIRDLDRYLDDNRRRARV